MKNDPVQPDVFSEEDIEKFIHALKGKTPGVRRSLTTVLYVTKSSGALSIVWR